MEYLEKCRKSVAQYDKQQACLELMEQIRNMIPLAYRKSKSVVEFNMLAKLAGSLEGATVFLAQDTTSKKFVIVKQYLHTTDPWGIPELVFRQLSCSLTFLHSLINSSKTNRIATHIQKILDLQIQENVTHIVFEYYPIMFNQIFCGSKMEYNSHYLLSVVDDLLQTVADMHKCGVAHRDLKLQNLGFDENSNVVILDFDSGAHIPMPLARNGTYPVCTLQTRPPEHMRLECETVEAKNGMYDAQAGDWWSVGCVIAQLYLSGCQLFAIQSGWNLPQLLANIEAFCVDFHNLIANPHHVITHLCLKSLLRTSMPLRVKMLLYGLLSLDSTKRKPAAIQFLSMSKEK